MRSFVCAAAVCGLCLPGCRDEGFCPDPAVVAAPPAHSAPETTPGATTESGELPPREPDVANWIERLKTFGPGVPEAEAAIPDLIALAASQDTPPTLRRQVVLMLGRLGAPSAIAVPTLRQMLAEPAHGDEVPAAWSAKALALLGPLARDAVPELKTLIQDESAPGEARLNAIEALGHIGDQHPETISLMTRWLESAPMNGPTQAQLERQMALVDSLAMIGPGAAGAVPVLIRQLEHPQELLRAKTLAALAAIGPSASFAEHAIAERLVFDADADVRRQAALALGAIGPTESLLLVTLSEDPESEVRKLAALGLGRFRRLEEETRGALRELSQDADPGVRLEAARALSGHPQERTVAIATLLDLMLSTERTVRVEAARILEQLKPSIAELDLDARREAFRQQPESQRVLERLLRNLGLPSAAP